MNKRKLLLTILSVLMFAAMAQFVARAAHHQNENEMAPETMLSTYAPQPGKADELQDALARTWAAYTHDQAVFPEPHVLVRTTNPDGSVYFTEVFRWVSHYAPDHASDAIKANWRELETLCRRPDRKSGIEGHEVQLIVPKP
jgi:hypothetical protein